MLDRTRRGASTVEMAITLPIFVLFLFATIEFGRALMVQQGLTSAAREGTRAACMPGATNQDVQQLVLTTLNGLGIQSNNAQVQFTPSTLASVGAGQMVSVRVQVPYSSISYLASPFFLGNAQLSGICTMRSEAD